MVSVDWFAWPIAIISGLLVSYFLYRKLWAVSKFWKISALLRFLTTSTLVFLIFRPTFQYVSSKLVKPEIIVYTDISKSATSQSNTVFLNLKALANKEFGEDVVLKRVDFASQIYGLNSPKLINTNSTRLDNIIQHFGLEQMNQSVVGGVLISDGIFNEGQNPNFQSLSSPNPLWAIGVGDTTQYPDVLVESLLCNEKVALGNTTEIEITLKSVNQKNENIDLYLFFDNQLVKKYAWVPNLEVATKAFNYSYQANNIGWHTVKAVVKSKRSESNAVNNSLSKSLEVVNQTKKVHVVYGGAHPDVKCLIQSIKMGLQTDVSSESEDEVNNIKGSDLVVFHGLKNTRLIQQCIDNAIPFWVFANNKKTFESISNFTNLEVSIPNGRIQWQEVQAYVNPDFGHFSVENLQDALPAWKPVNSPLLKYKLGAEIVVQEFQKWNGLKTNFPLCIFSEKGQSRSIWFMGDGIWKWRLQELTVTQKSLKFDEWVGNNIMWLANSTEKNDPIKINLNKRVFLSGERIFVEILNRDATGKLVTNKEVVLKVIDSLNNEVQTPIFTTNNKFKGVIENLKPGPYRLKAFLKDIPNIATSVGLNVQSFSLEERNSKADYKTLEKMALKTGGAFVGIKNLNLIINDIKKNSLQSKRSLNLKIQEEMSRLFPLLILLVVLFSAEWFLRKWMGKI